VNLPSHVRAVCLRGPVLAQLRAIAARGDVPVLLGPGVPQPELPGLRWATLGNLHVAGVAAPTAVVIAQARDEAEGELLGREAPARCAWVLYLDADARCYVVPFPVAPPSTRNSAGQA
jgi:hypothetical protein